MMEEWEDWKVDSYNKAYISQSWYSISRIPRVDDTPKLGSTFNLQ